MASALPRLSNVLFSLALLLLFLISFLQAAMPPPSPPSLDFLSLCSAIDHLLQKQLQSLGLLLSPCPIFILTNLIVFMLLFKSCSPSSSSNSTTLVGSDHAPPQLTADTYADGHFFAVAGCWDQSGPHADYYHVLSFSNYIHDQEPCVEYTNNWIHLHQQLQKGEAQANKLTSEGDLCMKGSQKEARLVPRPTNMGSKTFETQALNEQSVPWRVVDTQQKAQVVVINMELPRISRTNTPPLSKQSLCEAKAAEQNTKGKIKDTGVANIGIREGLKYAKEGGAKPAEKGKRIKADDVSRERATSIPTNKSMQRTRLSMKISPSFQPIALPTSSLDSLSDDEANKRFSDFIASRLAHMKNESLL